MNLLFPAMKKHFPKLNTKAYDFSDVELIAKRERIKLEICRYDPDILGYYCIRRTPKRKKKFIVINEILDQTNRTFVGLHELGHHFLHAPVTNLQWFYCRRNAKHLVDKHDCEADNLALLAMIPFWMLCEFEGSNHENVQPEFLPLFLKRKKLWEQWAI